MTDTPVGYIRTCALTRVLPMIGTARATRIVARRSRCPRESHLRLPCLRRVIERQEEWSLAWNRTMGPLPIDEIWKELLADQMGDLVVNEVDWITGPYLLKMKSKSGPDVAPLKYVAELNEAFRKEVGYPVGVLDLVDVRRAVRGFPRVDEFSVEQIRAVLRSLHADGWAPADRTIVVDGVKVTARPAAIRHYSETSDRGLKLTGEEDA